MLEEIPLPDVRKRGCERKPDNSILSHIQHGKEAEVFVHVCVGAKRTFLPISKARHAIVISGYARISKMLVDSANILYHYIQETCGFKYTDEKGFDGDIGQELRTFRELESKRRGTCIDLVRFFLSCVAQAKFRPVYIHIRSSPADHALVGVWLHRPALTRPVIGPDLIRQYINVSST